MFILIYVIIRRYCTLFHRNTPGFIKPLTSILDPLESEFSKYFPEKLFERTFIEVNKDCNFALKQLEQTKLLNDYYHHRQ